MVALYEYFKKYRDLLIIFAESMKKRLYFREIVGFLKEMKKQKVSKKKQKHLFRN